SANFPFGFNLLHVEGIVGPKPGSKQDRTSWAHLIDGGFVDNTGIDTIYEVFRGLKALADSIQLDANARDGDGRPARATPSGHMARTPAEKASQIISRLHGRMMLLFEIDSGAKPQAPGMFTKMASLIMEPINGHTNVSYTNAELAKRTYLNELRRMGGLLDVRHEARNGSASSSVERTAEPPDAVTHLPFVCNHL